MKTSLEELRNFEVRIRVSDSQYKTKEYRDDTMLTRFDDGSLGVYILDPIHHVRIWVRFRVPLLGEEK